MLASKRLRVSVLCLLSLSVFACATGGDVVHVTKVSESELAEGLDEDALSSLAEIKEVKKQTRADHPGLEKIIKQTPNYSVEEYLSEYPHAGNPKARNYTVGGYDVLDIKVYEEADLSREGIPVSADGYISLPLVGRLKVEGITTSAIESLISQKLAEGQYLLEAHVSVIVVEFKSKQFIVLGSIKEPGTYPLQASERVLDAVSRAGGIDFEQGVKHGMIIRTVNPDSNVEKKIVIRIDLPGLLKSGDQHSNLLLMDRDLLFIPKADNFYIIGQVKDPGSYPYLENEISLVEAISMAGGFTQIAARNKTRIIRVENGVEKIIEVRVDAITDSGKKTQDILILPGDVIVVPESFF